MKKLFTLLLLSFVICFHIQASPDKKATKEKTKKEDTKKDYYKPGFTGISELGTSMDGLAAVLFPPSKVKAIFAFNEVIGSRTRKHLFVGVGFGIEATRSLLIVPVTLDMRIYFINKRVNPFLNIAPGYALFHITGDNAHSFITNAGLGVEFKINKKVGVLINGGYRLTLLPRKVFEGIKSFNGTTNDLFHGGFVKFGVVY